MSSRPAREATKVNTMKNEKHIPESAPSPNAEALAPIDSTEARLAKLQGQRSKALAKIREIQGRNLSLQQKAEARKRFLVGEAILNDAAKSPETRALFMRLLESTLRRNKDRALFGLPMLDEGNTTNPSITVPN